MCTTPVTRARSNDIYNVPNNVQTKKVDTVHETDEVESEDSIQTKEKPTVQKTDLKSSGEMIVELDNSVKETENKPIQELNTRGSKVFNQPVLKQDADDIVLSETKDDAKPIQHESIELLTEKALINDVSKLVKKLDSSILKSSKENVYVQAESFGKDFVEKLDPKSKLGIDFISKSPEEKKDMIAELVFGLKPKYDVKFQGEYNNASEIYTKINEIGNLNSQFSNEMKKENPDQEKLAELRKNFFQKANELSPQITEAFKQENVFNDKGEVKDLNSLPNIHNFASITFPTKYSTLPENKQILIDRIFSGMEKATPPGGNEITNMLDPLTLPPKQQEKLQGYLKQIPGNTTVELPSSIKFQGKTYNFDMFLGGGGDGVAFAMKSKDGDKIVVKSPLIDTANKTVQKEANKVMKSEALSHITAMGDGHKNVLEMKGILRGKNTVMTVTEFAKGGELNEVVDKINTAPISQESQNILKLVLTKDAVQGLQFVQTEQNMSHYDVKPKNFFVSEDGSSKLSDFGRAGFGHKVECSQMTAAYMPSEARPKNKNYNPSEKIDTFAMGITLDQILNSVNYDDDNVRYERKEDTPLNKLISKMTDDNYENRPTLTAVLQHSVFNNPILNSTDVIDKSHQLISAMIDNRTNDIARLNNELTELLKTIN